MKHISFIKRTFESKYTMIMKNFVLSLLLILPMFIFAQETKKDKQLFVGYVAGGVNATQIAGDRMAGYRKLGANAGVGSYIMYTPKFSNSVEIAYTMKGSQSRFKNNDPSNFSKFVFDYVEIPLLFNYHEQKIAIFHAGFSFGRLIRYSLYDASTLLMGDPKKWDFAAVVGATFLIKERFGLQLKANFSVNSLWTLPDSTSRARRGGWYHNVLNFRFAYLFVKK